MARAFSTSVLALRVISVARCFTIPSVRTSFVGWRQAFNSERFALRDLPGEERSTAQLRVLTRLVRVNDGVLPAGNSAAMSSRPAAALVTFRAVPEGH